MPKRRKTTLTTGKKFMHLQKKKQNAQLKPQMNWDTSLAPSFEFLFRLTKVINPTEHFLDLFSSDIFSPTVFVGPFSNLFFIV